MSNLTDQGEKRMRKRLGLNKSGLEKSFGDALLRGKKHSEFKGAFKRFLDEKAILYRSMPIIHGHNIYWVKGSSLITVYQVPARFRKYL